MINTQAFFKNLEKSSKELSTTEKHYIIKTPTREMYINKQNYQVERLIVRIPDEDGINYEHYEITEQAYNNPAWEADSLYVIPKPTTQAPKEEKHTPLVKNSPAPTWKLPKVDSADSLSLNDLKGKVVLLDFWYTGCPPCVEFMPKLKQIQAEFEAQGFTIVSMALDTSKDNILKFMNRRGGIAYPTVLCAYKHTTLHHVAGFPYFVLIGKDGKVKFTRAGTILAYPQLTKHIKKELKK